MKLNEPFVVIAVAFVAEANHMIAELTNKGYKCAYVLGSQGIPPQRLSEGEKYADFYIGTKSSLASGWRNNTRSAAMFCFAPLSWDGFLQMEARLSNGKTFYANGKYHHKNGIKV